MGGSQQFQEQAASRSLSLSFRSSSTTFTHHAALTGHTGSSKMAQNEFGRLFVVVVGVANGSCLPIHYSR